MHTTNNTIIRARKLVRRLGTHEGGNAMREWGNIACGLLRGQQTTREQREAIAEDIRRVAALEITETAATRSRRNAAREWHRGQVAIIDGIRDRMR